MIRELIGLYRIIQAPPIKRIDDNSIASIQAKHLLEEKRQQFSETARACAESIRKNKKSKFDI